MRLLLHSLFWSLAVAQSSTSIQTAMKTSDSSMLASQLTTAAPSASTAAYSITALPAVIAQPACVFNCLIPIGLADPSGCDDVNNECACLSAPSDVLDFFGSCIQTVCSSSTSAYAAVATELYNSYCLSVFGAAQISQAFSSEAAAAAASTTAASAISSTTSVASSAPGTNDGDSAAGKMSLFAASICIAAGLAFLVAS